MGTYGRKRKRELKECRTMSAQKRDAFYEQHHNQNLNNFKTNKNYPRISHRKLNPPKLHVTILYS